MISDSEAVVLSLRFGKSRAGVHSPSGEYFVFVIIYSSVPDCSSFPPMINCVAILFGVVIELETGSILTEQCPSTYNKL